MAKRNVKVHNLGASVVAEVKADGVIIRSVEDGIGLVGDLYYQDFDNAILHEKNIDPSFFDLKTRIAGEILQKFSNYRMRVALVGDFTKFESNSLNNFIYESNKGLRVNFAASVNEGLVMLAR